MPKPHVVVEELYGNCPVQGEGTINDKRFYFRARHDHWSLGIGGNDPAVDPVWEWEEPWGKASEAGWMPLDIAENFINRCAQRYAAGESDNRNPGP